MLTEVEITQILKNIPESPGVYRYYAFGDIILYVGKAKNLKKRVASYFQQSRPKSERMMVMLAQIDKIDYTQVRTEKEALILEANLIHALQPKFNILLKDDRSYLYVRSTRDPIPGFTLARKKYDPNSKYFGPFTRKFAVSEILRTLRIIFPYCNEKIPQNKPCNYVAIKQCDGICVGRESMEDYKNKIIQIENVFKGKTKNVKIWIKNKMENAIEKNDFELAALWRDKIELLETTVSDQKIVLENQIDIDILTLCIKLEQDGMVLGSIFVQNIRDGRIVNVNNFLLNGNCDIFETDNKTVQSSEQLSEIATDIFTRFLNGYSQGSGDQIQIYLSAYLID